MGFELVGGGVTHELHGVAPFDQPDAFADQPFEFDRLDLGAILLALTALLRVFVIVEFAADAAFGAVEQIAERPAQVFKVGFEPGVEHGCDEGIEYVGVGETPEEAWKGKIITANGIKIGFIAASYSSYNDNGSRRNPFVARIEDVELMRNSIQRLRDEGCQFVVATMHAGIEYTRRPHQPQIDFARAAIDNGADIVIGGHPHWIQTTEVYRGKYIFYSLGNFIFDQRKPDTMEGLAIKVTVAHDGGVNVEKTARLDRVDLIPVIVERFGAPRVANQAESAAILRKIGINDPVISPK